MTSMLSKLSLECLIRILNFLTIDDLQQVALTARYLRSSVLELNWTHPTLFPLNQENFPEILVKLTKTLLLNETMFNDTWLKKVLDHFTNVDTLEITVHLSRPTVSLLCRAFAKKKKAQRTLYVLPNEMKRWITQKGKTKSSVLIKPLPLNFRETRAEIMAIKQEIVHTNPLLKNVSFTPMLDVGPNWQSVATALMELKASSRKKLQSHPTLDTILEALSLNNIVVMASEHYHAYGLDVGYWEKVVDESRTHVIQNLELKQEELNVLDDVVNDFAKCCSLYLSRISERVKAYKELSCYHTKAGEKVITMLENLSKKVAYSWNACEVAEDTYIKRWVDPILSAFLDKNIPTVELFGSDHELNESRARKLLQAALDGDSTDNVRGRYADYSGMVILSEEAQHHVFLCEIKTRKAANKRGDMVKLGSMMKDCIDMIIMRGLVPSKCIVVSLLVGGEACSLFSMDIPAKQLYRMTEIGTFYLPTSHKDMHSLVHTYKYLYLCASLVERQASVLLDDGHYVQANSNYAYTILSCSSPKRHADYYS